MRPTRAFYGSERALRCYEVEDAFAAQLLRASAGEADGVEQYMDHLDLGRFVLLLSNQRLCVVDETGAVHLKMALRDVACCEVRPDGIALHLFDPVSLRAARPGRYGGPPEETLVRFIRCRSEPMRREMNDRIQRALRALL